MKVKLKKFDGVYADDRDGYKSRSYNILNDSHDDSILLGRLFLTIRVDEDNNEVGIEKMLLIPCVLSSDAHRVSVEYSGLGYWFKTNNPVMCCSEDSLRANLCFIMNFTMKMISDVGRPPRVAMYIAGVSDPTVVDRSTIDKCYFTYEHDFCRYWIPKILPKKLMKLVEPKANSNEPCYAEDSQADTSVNHAEPDLFGEVPNDQLHSAIGSDNNDNPPGVVL